MDCYNKNRYNKNRYVAVGWRIDHGFPANKTAERDAPTAERAPVRPVIVQPYQEGGKRYYARDADALLEEISAADQARPGHPCG